MFSRTIAQLQPICTRPKVNLEACATAASDFDGGNGDPPANSAQVSRGTK